MSRRGWIAALLALGASGRGGWSCLARPRAAGANPRTGGIRLTDVTAAAGIRFAHSHGGSGRRYFVETMSGGGAFLDYDGDGWLDLFLTQGTPLPGTRVAGRPLPALYRNRGDGTFVDVTPAAGLALERYTIGAAAGDYDNDGDPDLYLTALGGNLLLRNDRGIFREVTRRAGVAGKDLSASAAWVDYDADGWPDLFVCRYVDYSLAGDRPCKDAAGSTVYCSPQLYDGTHALLYRNNGDGTFRDVSEAAGLRTAAGRALGVACADFSGDGRPDLFVANDLTPNHLWVNRGGDSFREAGAASGVSHPESGNVRSGMGTDVADVDNDGTLDLVVTTFENEPLSLFHGAAGGALRDRSYPSGLGSPSLPYVQWGCGFADLDRDGWTDLFVASGHVDDTIAERRMGASHAQPCQVFRNDGSGTFSEVSGTAGPFFARRITGRGAAFGDYDNDGDTDVLVACNNGPPVLLRNDTATPHGWLRLALTGDGCSRDALGARVRVTAAGRAQTQFVRSGGSYLSDHDRRLLFGMAGAEEAAVEIRWPCGALQSLRAQPGTLERVQEAGCRLRRRSEGGASLHRPGPRRTPR